MPQDIFISGLDFRVLNLEVFISAMLLLLGIVAVVVVFEEPFGPSRPPTSYKEK